LAAYAKSPKVTRERLYLESVEQFLPGPRKYVMETDNSRVLPLLPLGPQEGFAGGRSKPSSPESAAEKKGN